MKQTYFCAHTIDKNANTAEKITLNIGIKSDALENWCVTLIHKVMSTDKREYSFSDTSYVKNNVVSILKDEDRNSSSENVAKKLLSEEIKVSQRTPVAANKIKKGNLVQIIFEANDMKYFILSKVEEAAFLDTKDYKKHNGLPFENQIFKTALILIGSNNEPIEILLHDSNGPISKYWCREFLDALEVKSDEVNTKTTISELSKLLNRKLEKNSPSDYSSILNSTFGYFASNSTFSVSDYIDKVISSYEPENKNVSIDKLALSIKELAKEKVFDETFNIDKKVVAKNTKRKIKLSKKMELKITSNLEEDEIRSFDSSDGRKYIIIESPEGYKHFKKVGRNEIN